jgi:uncharacterized protein (TIGR03067 family)
MKYAVMILFLSATAVDGEADKKLLKELEGSYKMTSIEMGGQVVSTDGNFLEAVVEKVSLKGDKFTIIVKDKFGTKEVRGMIAVDPAKKPVHVDFKMSDQPQTASGIIAIDGGVSIKICIGDPDGNTRPTEFKTSKDDKNVLLALKKIKE